jgi:hypothetical protein
MSDKPKLSEVIEILEDRKEIKNNPFSELPNESIHEALKLIYEASEEIVPTLKDLDAKP